MFPFEQQWRHGRESMGEEKHLRREGEEYKEETMCNIPKFLPGNCYIVSWDYFIWRNKIEYILEY